MEDKELRTEIEKILDKFIPTMVTCPLCERVFDLTEIDWDELVKAVI